MARAPLSATDLRALDADVARRLADELCSCQVEAELRGERFNGNPHPGNVLLLDDGSLGLIQRSGAMSSRGGRDHCDGHQGLRPWIRHAPTRRINLTERWRRSEAFGAARGRRGPARGSVPAYPKGAVVAVVVAEDLHKRYGDNHAVRGVSFSVEEGEVFAVVGPNGAGKTTAVEILEGHRKRTSGRVQVLGFDPQTGGRAFRERIGIVLQEAGMDERFSVRELLCLYAGFYPRPRDVDEVIALVGLTGKAHERTKTLSGGQRRRVDLALGLIGDPDLLFLDEPTTGFDPSARRQAWEVVAGLCAIGKTVVLTTHYMEEAHRLADRVAIIAEGRLVALGTPEELMVESAGDGTVIVFTLPDGVTAAQLPRVAGAVHVDDGRVEVRTTAPTSDLAVLTGWAVGHDLELDGLRLQHASFEEAYLGLVGASLAAHHG